MTRHRFPTLALITLAKHASSAACHDAKTHATSDMQHERRAEDRHRARKAELPDELEAAGEYARPSLTFSLMGKERKPGTEAKSRSTTDLEGRADMDRRQKARTECVGRRRSRLTRNKADRKMQVELAELKWQKTQNGSNERNAAVRNARMAGDALADRRITGNETHRNLIKAPLDEVRL